MNKPAIRFRIVEAALPHVAFEGWSMAALMAGARDCGLSEAEIVRAFPRGVADALESFTALADLRMREAWEALPSPPAKMRDKIALLIRLRLEAFGPHREAVRRALALSALPAHAPLALSGLTRTLDLIWRLAGDRSVDFSWYTKRLTLSGVYTSTLLFWLNDLSAGNEQSWSFLDRRIENVMQLGKWKHYLRGKPAAATAPRLTPPAA